MAKKPTVKVPVNTPDSESLISMILGAMVVVVIGALVFSYVRDWRKARQTAPTPTPSSSEQTVSVEELPTSVVLEDRDGQKVPANLPAKYTVKEGDSTWKIAEAFYGSGFNYVDIEAANNLERDAELTAGMELTIPKTAVRDANSAGAPSTYSAQPGQATNGPAGPQKGDDSAAEKAQQE